VLFLTRRFVASGTEALVAIERVTRVGDQLAKLDALERRKTSTV
jgi:hypothetical protein